jgi:acyl carrier protein
MEGQIAERLTQTFRFVFDDPNLQVTPGTTANDVEGWDSVMHINLIVAAEKEFGVRFTTSEVMALRNVGDLADLIAKKMG